MGGSWNLLRHGTEYGERSESSKPAFDLSGSNNCFSPEPFQNFRNSPTAPDGFPEPFSNVFDDDGDGNVLEHFEPTSAAAQAAMTDPFPGTQYFVCGIPVPVAPVLPPGGQAAVAPGCVDGGWCALSRAWNWTGVCTT